MKKGKLDRFADNAARENVLEWGKPIFENIKGKWNSELFKNDHPLVLELGCGRGEYTVGLAREFPERNFIGVDIKGARIWVGSSQAIEEGLSNVAFLRTQIEWIERFFVEGEVSEIWITFPDPRPRKSEEKKRLTFPGFLEQYRKILKKDGLVHLKTDNLELFDYTLEVLEQRVKVKDLVYTHDLYQSPYAHEARDIKTKYEQLFTAQGVSIKYLQFRFD